MLMTDVPQTPILSHRYQYFCEILHLLKDMSGFFFNFLEENGLPLIKTNPQCGSHTQTHTREVKALGGGVNKTQRKSIKVKTVSEGLDKTWNRLRLSW